MGDFLSVSDTYLVLNGTGKISLNKGRGRPRFSSR